MLTVTPIPVFADNYIWLLQDKVAGIFGVVDPGEAAPVDRAMARAVGKDEQPFLSHIFITHHHDDHIGGAAKLVQLHGAHLVAPEQERARIKGIDMPVQDKQEIKFGRHSVQVLATPGHTSGHVAYFFPESRLLFCGDTLFSLGCGRLFEGTAEEMWKSLLRLRALPDDTQIFCGHEYTLANARFALAVDGENAALQARIVECQRLRNAARPTLPVTLAEEKATNPFLRADDPALQKALDLSGLPPAAVFASLRATKDHFQ